MTKMTYSGPAPQPDRELYLNAKNMRAAQIGPFTVATRVRARAYGFHRGAGASSKASLKLLYDGSPAGEATDQNFNLANLQVVNNIILDPGQSAAFALQSTNGSGVTERYVGLEFWLSAA